MMIVFNKFFSSFLWTGITFAIFQISGIFSSFNPVLNINLSGKAIDSPQICINFVEILSKLCAFLGSKVSIVNEISFGFTRKEVILALVLYANGGNELPLLIGANIDAEKSLNRLAFVQKSETNLPFTSKGGMAGIFYTI